MDALDNLKLELRPQVEILQKVEKFSNRINKLIKKKNIKAKCDPGGSVAKGTNLKGDFDVDLFVKFDYSYKDEDISKILGEVLKELNPTLVHGSRDYFQLSEQLNYEIVPVLDIIKANLAQNVMDMSPLHVSWVKKNLKKGQDDEMRLTKKFCKTSGVYGAESYINGFSGHVIDILIIYYGSFLELLKQSKKWKPKVIIDIEKHYKRPRDILFNLNQSKIHGPLIVVDPVMKTRNAASALSYEKFAIFKKKAAGFLKTRSEKYFQELIIGKTYLRNKFKTNLVIVTLESKQGKKDVVGSKILKAFKFLKIELQKRGFELNNSGWTWNEKRRVLFWFAPKKLELPSIIIVEGPPLDKVEHVKNFSQNYKEIFKKKGKIMAKKRIKKRELKENIIEISKVNFFKEKIKLKSMD